MQGIRDALDAMKRAWDAGDADAYAACFTADASYVSFVGTVYRGRADIADCHRALFSRFAKGTVMQVHRTEIDLHGPSLATAVTGGDATRKPLRAGAEPKVQTLTFVLDDGRWLCAAFQNTKVQPLMHRVSALIDKRFTPLRER